MIRAAIIAACLIVGFAGPAHAGPVVTAVAWAVQAVQAFAASSLLAGAFVKAAFSIGLSALARAITTPEGAAPARGGIKTEVTLSGGANPQSFVIGRYATAGSLICPPYSYGRSKEVPNKHLVYVVALACAAGHTLDRIIVNDDYIDLKSGTDSDGFHGVQGKLEGYCRVKYHDGTQTVADPWMLAKFGPHPKRPWSADMVGPGVPYVIIDFTLNQKRYSGLPAVRAEMGGIPLYDPRADSTVGGSGTQRWAEPSTWAQSENLAVQIYNILRGIALPDGEVWGGGSTAEDLPLDSWFAAMNECDLPIPLKNGGTEPQYRGGLEIAVNEEPLSIVEELKKGCAAETAEIGGIWKIRVGPPGLPVLYITDADILADEPQNFEPFPGLSDTYNGVTATYPEPKSLWETADAPPLWSAEYEAEDGDRRLVADMTFRAVPYPRQVQRLMQSYLKSGRRFRRHQNTLPPMAAILEPLDVLAWSSARWDYEDALFEVVAVQDELKTLRQTVQLRAVSNGDWIWDPDADERALAAAIPASDLPDPQLVPDFAVTGTTVADETGAVLKPALALSWTADDLEDDAVLQWQVRLSATETLVAQGQAPASEGAATVSDGILSATWYEVRAQLLNAIGAEWTDWILVQSGTASATSVAIGKTDAADTETGGIYIGDDGATAVMAVGSGAGEVAQSLTYSTGGGLEILNARHLVRGGLTAAPSYVTASQSVALTPGMRLDLALMAPGGGGAAGNGGADGTAGGDVTVTLYDDTTLIQSWTAAGGTGGHGKRDDGYDGQRGMDTAWGAPGAPGKRVLVSSPYVAAYFTYQHAADATGYGASGSGGAGSEKGGARGALGDYLRLADIDISGLAAPRIEVTIGARGQGGSAGSSAEASNGGDGAPGRVSYAVTTITTIRADVVPLTPTATGTFAKPANGAATFPDLGSGIWWIDTGSDDLSLSLGNVQVAPAGDMLRLHDGKSANFVAAMTPVALGTNSDSRTIRYRFYAMGHWGDVT